MNNTRVVMVGGRFYRNFSEALNEIKRELREMSVRVHTRSVQNKIIENDPDFDTMELVHYTYTVLNPDPELIPENMRDIEWCHAEFRERVGGVPLNPGNAWLLRKPYWEQFLNSKGQFDYSYPERMSIPLQRVIDLLRQDPLSRRAFLSVFDPSKDKVNDLSTRVSCSLGYHFMYRQDVLSMEYHLRSSDYFEHLGNDLWQAAMLQRYVADACGMAVGPFYHNVGSLHCFLKNVKEVF